MDGVDLQCSYKYDPNGVQGGFKSMLFRRLLRTQIENYILSTTLLNLIKVTINLDALVVDDVSNDEK